MDTWRPALRPPRKPGCAVDDLATAHADAVAGEKGGAAAPDGIEDFAARGRNHHPPCSRAEDVDHPERDGLHSYSARPDENGSAGKAARHQRAQSGAKGPGKCDRGERRDGAGQYDENCRPARRLQPARQHRFSGHFGFRRPRHACHLEGFCVSTGCDTRAADKIWSLTGIKKGWATVFYRPVLKSPIWGVAVRCGP